MMQQVFSVRCFRPVSRKGNVFLCVSHGVFYTLELDADDLKRWDIPQELFRHFSFKLMPDLSLCGYLYGVKHGVWHYVDLTFPSQVIYEKKSFNDFLRVTVSGDKFF